MSHLPGQSVTTCSVPAGPKGPKGPEVGEPPHQNVPGNDGSVVIRSANDAIDQSATASATSVLYLQTALRSAEVSYANAAHEEALDQLVWLGRLLIHPEVVRSTREAVFDSGLEPVESSQEREALRRKVFTLIERLALQLDYWGNTSDFVPLLSQRAYTEVLDEAIGHAKDIESAYIRYRDARDDWLTARGALSDAIRSQEDYLGGLQDRFQALSRVEFSLIKDIEDLSNAYDSRWRLVLEAGDQFKAAVRREAKCRFEDVVVAVGAISTAVGTMGTGAGAAIAAWQAYNKFNSEKADPEDRLGSFAEPKYKIDKVVSIGKGVAQVANGIQEISEILDRGNPQIPSLPSDAAKLLMSRQELQETIDPFRHLPEAREYIDRVDRFIELVTTRNNKIVEYNALANGRAEAEADIDGAEGEISRLRSEINRPNVRHLPEFASFMARANMMNKRTIMQALYKQHRALEYWAGEISPFRLQRDSIDHLATTHSQAKIRLLNAMENRGRELQKFGFDDRIAVYSLREVVAPDDFDAFKREGKLIFGLIYAPFEGMALVRLLNVRVRLPGVALKSEVRGSDPFGLRLKHFGSARLTTEAGTLIEFRHEPRQTFMFYHVDAEVTRAFNLGGSETYIKLTPEGPWEISILEADLDRISLSELSDIILEFEGEFLPAA